MEQESMQGNSSEQPSESNFLTGAQLQLVKLKSNPIEDAFMEGFYAGVNYGIVYLQTIEKDEFEAAWSYKEAYLRKIKEEKNQSH